MEMRKEFDEPERPKDLPVEKRLYLHATVDNMTVFQTNEKVRTSTDVDRILNELRESVADIVSKEKTSFFELRKHHGMVKISREHLEGHTDEVMEFLKDMLILRAEMMYHTDGIEYIALCKDFDPVESNMIIPVYGVELVKGKLVIRR